MHHHELAVAGDQQRVAPGDGVAAGLVILGQIVHDGIHVEGEIAVGHQIGGSEPAPAEHQVERAEIGGQQQRQRQRGGHGTAGRGQLLFLRHGPGGPGLSALLRAGLHLIGNRGRLIAVILHRIFLAARQTRVSRGFFLRDGGPVFSFFAVFHSAPPI